MGLTIERLAKEPAGNSSFRACRSGIKISCINRIGIGATGLRRLNLFLPLTPPEDQPPPPEDPPFLRQRMPRASGGPANGQEKEHSREGKHP